ncbi:MAG: hypothetical protein ACF8PN_02020 [Phycisphaerales bacterium]
MLMNVFITLAVVLVAYWWAGQGFFSAILHAFSVFIAATVAFAAWEFMSVWALGKIDNPALTDMAWGVSLILVFTIVLQLLRPLTTRACPANVNVSHTVNFLGGGAVGAVAGILTAGICFIGVQFIQGPTELLGYSGWTITRTGEYEREQALWVPVDQLTAGYFTLASEGPLWVPNPISEHHPELALQASLYRHSFDEGKSRMGIKPEEFSIDWVKRGEPDATPAVLEEVGSSVINKERHTRANQGDLYHIRALFNAGAWDAGNKLHITRQQVRLVVRTPEGDYVGLHPHAFIEPVSQDTTTEGRWVWEDTGIPATSVGTPERAGITFEFIVPPGSTLQHLKVRQARKDLPALDAETVSAGEITTLRNAGEGQGIPAPPGAAITTARAWQGYLMSFVLVLFAMFSNLMPAKRGHQD